MIIASGLDDVRSGSYSRLWATFTFNRNAGFYVLQVCVPAVLVVCISWVSFWINRDSAPARTSLGILTVLTETQLMTSTNRQLPPVSYVKVIAYYYHRLSSFAIHQLVYRFYRPSTSSSALAMSWSCLRWSNTLSSLTAQRSEMIR